MKKILGVVAVAAVLAPSFAAAQSDLTLYGRADASYNYRSFGSTPTVGATAGKPETHYSSVSSDTSYWGIVGKEDLGNGRKAYFKMENGFNIDTGAQGNATTLFNREAYVGLGDSAIGNIQLGSQFGPTVAITGEVDPFQRSNLGGNGILFQNGPATTRGYTLKYDNAIQYLSPTTNAVSVRALVSLGEGSVPGPNYAGSVRYVAGPLMLGSIYDRNRILATTVGLTGATVTSQTLALGAKYVLGFGTLNAYALTNRIPGLPHANGYSLGAVILAGPGEIRTSVARQDVGTGKGTLGAIGYFYLISKRTMLYTAAGRLTNQGTSIFSMAPTVNESTAAGLPGKGQSVNGFSLGMRAMF